MIFKLNLKTVGVVRQALICLKMLLHVNAFKYFFAHMISFLGFFILKICEADWII